MSYDSVEQLRSVIEEILADKFGIWEVDDDGDYFVDKGRVRVYVTPIDWGDGDTLVKIWTVAAYDVDGSKKLMAYLNDLNRRSIFGAFYYQHGMVYNSQTLIGNTLDREELLWTIKGVAKMTKQVDKLMERGFGGVSYDWTYDFGEDWYYKPLSQSEYELGYAAGALFLAASVDASARDAWAWAFDDEDEFDEFFDMLADEDELVEEALSEWEVDWEAAALDDEQAELDDELDALAEEQDALEDELDDYEDEPDAAEDDFDSDDGEFYDGDDFDDDDDDDDDLDDDDDFDDDDDDFDDDDPERDDY